MRPQVDMDLINTYEKDGLWKKDLYYFGLLEEAIRANYFEPLDRQVIVKIDHFMRKRRQLVLEKTFTEEGEVITPVKETRWQRIKRRVLSAVSRIKRLVSFKR